MSASPPSDPFSGVSCCATPDLKALGWGFIWCRSCSTLTEPDPRPEGILVSHPAGPPGTPPVLLTIGSPYFTRTIKLARDEKRIAAPDPVTPPNMSASAGTDRLPTTQPEPSVWLGEFGDNPIVLGVEKAPLSLPQYDAIKVLIDAGRRGLTKDELASKSKHSDAVGIIDRLRNRDPDWAKVIRMAGKPGGRYRIIP